MKQAALQERIERCSKRKRLITLVPFRHYFDSLVILASITEFPRTKRFPAPTPAGSGSGNRDREAKEGERTVRKEKRRGRGGSSGRKWRSGAFCAEH